LSRYRTGLDSQLERRQSTISSSSGGSVKEEEEEEEQQKVLVVVHQYKTTATTTTTTTTTSDCRRSSAPKRPTSFNLRVQLLRAAAGWLALAKLAASCSLSLSFCLFFSAVSAFENETTERKHSDSSSLSDLLLLCFCWK